MADRGRPFAALFPASRVVIFRVSKYPSDSSTSRRELSCYI
jgi:hypothetical protein